jgi:hypothetical protein
MDANHKLALQALVHLSHDTDLEFVRKKAGQEEGPLFIFMLRARRDALDALIGLFQVPPDQTESIRKLQNEVQRFIDTVEFVKEVQQKGYEAANELREEEAAELRELVHDNEDDGEA